MDIDGDLCHHIHNTVKQLCKSFEYFVQKSIDDINWDTKYITDILDSLKEICFILNLPFRGPPQRVSHHCLSVFSCVSINMTLNDPLVLLYYALIPNDFRDTHEGDIKTIFDKYELNEKAKTIINAILTKMKAKEINGWRQREQRKNRNKIILWKVNSFAKLKSFCVRRNCLYIDCIEVLLKFSTLLLVALWSLKWLNLIDVALNVWKLKTLYVGDEKVTKNKIQRDIATDFYRKLHPAYVTVPVCFQKKYALNNPLLNFFVL